MSRMRRLRRSARGGDDPTIRPGSPPETRHLCEVHLAERRGVGSGFGGLGMFDDFFSRFFSDAAGVGLAAVVDDGEYLDVIGRQHLRQMGNSVFDRPSARLGDHQITCIRCGHWNTKGADS